MSILKSIMHHWNKTTKSYDTLHPETESAQITDWHSGIMASLASKTLGTVVDAITTDSVLGKLIKMLLDASGVKYLIDTNGYVCFGSLFGGLIIQWGTGATDLDNGYMVTFPLSFAKVPCSFAIPSSIGGTDTFSGVIATTDRYNDEDGKSQLGIWTATGAKERVSAQVFWVAIGN